MLLLDSKNNGEQKVEVQALILILKQIAEQDRNPALKILYPVKNQR
jgi:hypothetical protein